MLIVLKIILCSGILLGLYHLFLVKEKTFTFNRFYLIAALLFSLCIPFATIETKEVVKEIPATVFPESIEQPVETQILTQQESFDYTPILLIIYCSIAAFLLFKIVYSVLKIKRLKGRKIKYQNRTVFLLKQDLAPFSFWNTIYLSETYFKDSKIEDSVFLHEEIHIKQKHSLDILLVEVLKAVFWINPLIGFYKKAMVNNHEFLADESVISQNKNIKQYQELILQEILKQQNLPLIHQFNFNNTKKRFIMMNNKNSKFAKVKNYLAVPAFAVLAIIFAEKTYAKESNENLNQEKESIISDVFSNDPLSEYNQIIKKYGNLVEQKKYAEFDKVISLSDRAKLKELYFQLTKEQRDETPLYFFDVKKSERVNVSQKQLDDFMNSKKYGLWIDGKKTNNLDLKKYKPEDFSHESVSKRYPNAISKKNPEPYQVDLMTNQYFKDYRNEKEKIFMGFKAKAFIKGKDTIPIKRNIEGNLNKKNEQDLSTAAEGTQANITPAEYPGGVNELRKKVSKNFNSAIFSDSQGLVKSTITFVVDKNGNIRDLKTEGENEKFNNEVFRVTKEANENITWKPATKDGEPVAYRYNLPIAMQFASYKKTQ
ncbi:M56 family metallopeptidase [Chryseobacterium sp. YIM B08800]|uniref:M56 family metallopeptidase n=1 Tax=Chryseobacterium sp. YIM B08800 TaxID=2984136 RepID=UPI00223FEA24|nr:M56 family metallopeptidase [Chryseobacterium sp. YIM B08800]